MIYLFHAFDVKRPFVLGTAGTITKEDTIRFVCAIVKGFISTTNPRYLGGGPRAGEGEL